jgi:acyl carrier protein
MTNRGLIMTVSGVRKKQRTRTTNGSSVDIDKVRALIAKHLDVDIRRVTDDADLSHDLGADWLDRLELIILVEEIAGVEIADHETNRIGVVGDLIRYVDESRNVTRSALRGRGSSPASCNQPCTLERNHMPIRGLL